MGCGIPKGKSRTNPLISSIGNKEDSSTMSLYPGFLSSLLYLFSIDSNHDNLILKFDGQNEEWESLPVTQPSIKFFEESQALQVDSEIIILSGGRMPTMSNEYATGICYIYLAKKNKFYPFPTLNYPRSNHMILSFADSIYCMGGKISSDGNDGIINSVERIDLGMNKTHLKDGIEDLNKEQFNGLKWNEVEPFNIPRHNSTTFIYKSEIYLLGGMGRNNKIIKIVEKYNPQQNEWIVLKWKLPFSVYCASIANLTQSEIIIIGGRNESGLVPSIYQMDFSKKLYQSKGAFSFRINPKILHHNNDVYIFGGDKEMSCEKLNPVQFISYAASESYTSFINNDLSSFPAAHPTIRIGDGLYSSEDSFSDYFDKKIIINDDYLKPLNLFYTLGTPNHPFILEYCINKEEIKFLPVGFELRFFYYGSCFRINQNYAVTIGGITPPRKKATKKVQLISLKNFHSKKLKKSSIGRCKSSLIGNITDNKLYLIGGITFEMNNEIYLNKCERYSIEKDEWELIADLNIARFNLQTIFFKNRLFAIGGFDGSNYLKSIESWQENENKWNLIDNFQLDKGLSSFSIGYIGYNIEETGEFLLFGGNNKVNYSNEVKLINFETHKIKNITELKECRSGHKIIRYEDGFLILGGSRTDIGVEIVRKSAKYESFIEGFKVFDEALSKYYRDKTLGGIQGC